MRYLCLKMDTENRGFQGNTVLVDFQKSLIPQNDLTNSANQLHDPWRHQIPFQCLLNTGGRSISEYKDVLCDRPFGILALLTRAKFSLIHTSIWLYPQSAWNDSVRSFS